MMQQAQHQVRQLEAQRRQEWEAKQAETKRQHEDALVKALPHLANPEKRRAFDDAVRTEATARGFTEDEIKATTDPRILRMVADLTRLRKATNAKAAQRRIERPKATKPRAGVRTQDVAYERAKRRFSQTKSVDDAAALLDD